MSTLGVENQEIICAVSESRGVSPSVGMAFLNLDTGEAVLSQFSDSQTYVRTIHKVIFFRCPSFYPHTKQYSCACSTRP
jgi:DNA mismatch repair protein MSH4